MDSLSRKKERLLKRKERGLPKQKSLSTRLSEIEGREGISGNALAKILGVSSTDYHGSLKANKQKPKTAWRIALYFIDKYGLKDLQVH